MTQDASFSIRLASNDDLPAIVEIYNQAIRAGNSTAHQRELLVQERESWFESFDPTSYPIYIAESREKTIAYGTLSPYRAGREALSSVAEISFYIDYDFHRQGIGSALMAHLVAEAKHLGKQHLLAILMDINQPSIGLLTRHGFIQWGYFPDIVNLKNQRCGHVIYGRAL